MAASLASQDSPLINKVKTNKQINSTDKWSNQVSRRQAMDYVKEWSSKWNNGLKKKDNENKNEFKE